MLADDPIGCLVMMNRHLSGFFCVASLAPARDLICWSATILGLIKFFYTVVGFSYDLPTICETVELSVSVFL